MPVTAIDSHRYICDLINLEGPVLSLFRDDKENWLYLWCDTDGERSHRWLIFPSSRELLVSYLRKESSLLDLVRSSTYRLILDGSFSTILSDDGLPKGRSLYRAIKKIDGLQEIECYLPASDSFFDEELTPDISLAREISPTAYDVPISGQWFFTDLDGFSKLYGQLYSFFYCTQPQFITNIGRRVQRYLEAPWRGGYSRVNLFDALEGMIPSLHDLKIKKMHYASPGEIRIEALQSVGISVSNVIKRYIECRDDLAVSQKLVNGFLISSRLRKQDLSMLGNEQLPVTAENIDFLQSKTQEIARTLGIEQELNTLNERSPNIIVSTKVLIAVLSRISRLSELQDAGLLDLNRAPPEASTQ